MAGAVGGQKGRVGGIRRVTEVDSERARRAVATAAVRLEWTGVAAPDDHLGAGPDRCGRSGEVGRRSSWSASRCRWPDRTASGVLAADVVVPAPDDHLAPVQTARETASSWGRDGRGGRPGVRRGIVAPASSGGRPRRNRPRRSSRRRSRPRCALSGLGRAGHARRRPAVGHGIVAAALIGGRVPPQTIISCRSTPRCESAAPPVRRSRWLRSSCRPPGRSGPPGAWRWHRCRCRPRRSSRCRSRPPCGRSRPAGTFAAGRGRASSCRSPGRSARRCSDSWCRRPAAPDDHLGAGPDRRVVVPRRRERRAGRRSPSSCRSTGS